MGYNRVRTEDGRSRGSSLRCCGWAGFCEEGRIKSRLIPATHRQGVVAQAYDPSTLEGQEFRVIPGYMENWRSV